MTCRRSQSARAGYNVELNNLRAVVILTVLAFHSVLAYLGSLGASPFPFDSPPYEWRAFPIVDSHRWFGFDVFCAWQDVYLMSLMFFLSALFTWPSLKRKRIRKFLGDRFLRLGVPFVFALAVVMPLALYPAYRVTAVDPSLIAYGRHFLALPFWPNGPMWFLWQLLALTIVAAGLYRFAPHWVEFLGRSSSSAGTRPGRYFVGLAAAAALAYVPLALVFTPWAWSVRGPFALQFSRPLLYVVYYLAGLGIGAYGLERGLFAPEGMLARRWAVWLAGALASLLLWMGLTALAMTYPTSAPARPASWRGYQLCGGVRERLLFRRCWLPAVRSDTVADIRQSGRKRLWHVSVPLSIRRLAAIRPAGRGVARHRQGDDRLWRHVLFAWATTVALRSVPFGSRLIGAERRVLANAPSSQGNLRPRMRI